MFINNFSGIHERTLTIRTFNVNGKHKIAPNIRIGNISFEETSKINERLKEGDFRTQHISYADKKSYQLFDLNTKEKMCMKK